METTLTTTRLFNNEQTFHHEDFGEVRTIVEGDNILFVAADACHALGIDPTQIRRLDDDEKGLRFVQTLGGKQKMGVVTEAGLYRLIFTSHKPNAKEFQRWIFHEVIPAIRKTGFYVTPNAKITPDFLRQLASTLEMKDAKIAAQEIQIAELTPKANYYDKVLNSGGLLTTTDIAKDYRMSAVKFNKLLERLGVQFRRGGRWYLYQKYAQLGWSSGRTYLKNGSLIIAKTHMCWTQAGKHGLYNLLKEYGYRPSSELPSLFDLD